MRYFLRLYLFLVVAMLFAGWSVEKIWNNLYNETRLDPHLQDLLLVIETELKNAPSTQWQLLIQQYSTELTNNLMLVPVTDIAGTLSVEKLNNYETVVMRSSDRELWTLKKVRDSEMVLVIISNAAENSKTWIEWLLSLVLYAAIALAVMLWVWPLSRDINKLEKATVKFGDRSWVFQPEVKHSSQVYQLSQSFRAMADRIDRLIQSHKDISNAVSHEINTPLARMKFEIESSLDSDDIENIKQSLQHIKQDVNQINELVAATLKYAILDRADFKLKLARHNFTEVLPALVEQLWKQSQGKPSVALTVASNATDVICDYYLMETAINNLLVNAKRYAFDKVQLNFAVDDDGYEFSVADDGPGIAIEDRAKVFNSFTQLKQSNSQKGKFGLGLAIVKRIAEWHQGSVIIEEPELGGTRFVFRWPLLSISERQ